MKIKRIVAAALCLLLVLGCFGGCAREDGPAVEAGTKPQEAPGLNVKGRYVEKALALPECAYAKDMVMLADGRLRVALQGESGEILLYTSTSLGESWEEQQPLPAEITAGGNIEIETLALSPDGTVFCDTIETLADETVQPHLWVISPEGACRELPLTYPELMPDWGFFLPNADFTEDGRLFAQVYASGVHELNLETGEFGDNVSELETNLLRIGCGGNDVYMLGWSTASYYHDGQTTVLPEVLGTQVEENLKKTEGNPPRVIFWENPEGYLFFTTTEGLYSYIPGGAVTEELMQGAQCSLGDPRCYPIALTGTEDGSFYLLCNLDGEPALCRFVYDETVPTVAETELHIYTLYPDDDLSQMISRFQKENLEISVELEVGLSGESGMNEADAIRTLNTEILAGTGPDLICLDGFDLNTYLEKGLLADLSGLLAQAGPLLEQVTGCYGADGKICALPTCFAIPAIYGQEQTVSQIHDLPSLVAAAQQAREAHPDVDRIVNGMQPAMLADQYYDSCSAAWVKPDGTLDAQKLAQFYGAMKDLYALDESFRQENQDWIAAIEKNLDDYFAPGQYTGIGGAINVISEISYLSAGTLDSMEQWSFALGGEQEYLGEGYVTAAFSGQASNVFLPRRIMGILTTAAQPEAAETFLSFMLSDKIQAETLSAGFPVNRTVFDREIQEEGYTDAVFGSSDGEGNSISYTAKWPDAQRRSQLKGWVDALTTPASTNRTIRKMVLAQMADCCNGVTTPDQAAQAALQALNLYLSE
ncbi:MAG: ABC transporter substrate-binding protein [Eubacteriales bacterium]|nr:ABC transporter substrate-binding protein [Eubacteriales bacterium]